MSCRCDVRHVPRLWFVPYCRAALALVLLFATLASSGCATVVTGGRRPVTFESDPPGATVRANGQVLGKTPVTAVVKGTPTIEFQMVGYQTRLVNPNLESMWQLNPWIWGNLGWLLTGPGVLLGAPIGFMIDWMGDAGTTLRSPFRVSLYPVTMGPPSSSSGFLSPGPAPAQIPSVAPAPPCPADMLNALQALRDQRLITENEYQQKRQEVLDRVAGGASNSVRVVEEKN